MLKGWNKVQVARMIRVEAAVIGRVERGENQNPVTIKAIADALGIEMHELLIEDMPTANSSR